MEVSKPPNILCLGWVKFLTSASRTSQALSSGIFSWQASQEVKRHRDHNFLVSFLFFKKFLSLPRMVSPKPLRLLSRLRCKSRHSLIVPYFGRLFFFSPTALGSLPCLSIFLFSPFSSCLSTNFYSYGLKLKSSPLFFLLSPFSPEKALIPFMSLFSHTDVFTCQKTQIL